MMVAGSEAFEKTVSAPEFEYYYYFRGVDKDVAMTLENSDIRFDIQYGHVLVPDRIAEYNSKTNTITLNNKKSLSFEMGVLAIAHESRHAWQDVMASQATKGSFNEKKYKDIYYSEWDAYKFQGDLDDKLGWKIYWSSLFFLQCYCQSLNLDVSYADYDRWVGKYSGWEMGFRDIPPLLTEVDYE